MSFTHNPDRYDAVPVGVVLRRAPGVTRWAAWSWKAVSVLPGAGPANWKVLRDENGITDYHAATLNVELHGADTEAYLHGLAAQVPCLYAVLRETGDSARPFDAVLITASPYEAQDYADNGEDVVEKIAMPEGIVAWVRDFAHAHHEEEEFKKRRRDRKDISQVQDGIGDPRISQMTDVYRSPAMKRAEQGAPGRNKKEWLQ